MTTLAATLARPLELRIGSRLADLLLILGGSLFVALAAQLEIRLGANPVPVTAQTLAVLVVGASLGARRGALSLLAYLAEGAAGLPVFAGGAFGFPHLIGSTGGYLAGFVAAAWMSGLLAERGYDRRWWTALPAFIAGHSVIFAFGVLWLSGFVGREQALALGYYPFIPGELVKTALAAALLPSAWALARRGTS